VAQTTRAREEAQTLLTAVLQQLETQQQQLTQATQARTEAQARVGCDPGGTAGGGAADCRD
jgi:hypothetical protein